MQISDFVYEESIWKCILPQGDSNDDEAEREQKPVVTNHVPRSRGKGLLQIQIQDSKRQGPVELANKSDWKVPLSRLSEKQLSRKGKTLIVDRYKIKITREKIECLFGTSWLNSEVIAFWLEWWREQIGAGSEGNMPAQNSTSKCYFSSTYFYSKMMEGGYNYKAIKRWTKAIDVFALDMIVLPINETNSHWFLAVIDFMQQRIEIYDSMGKAHSAVRETLLRWLGDEHMSRKNSVMDQANWSRQQNHRARIPRQLNGSDCGVFMCLFAAYASLRRPFTFSQKDIPTVRRWMISIIAS